MLWSDGAPKPRFFFVFVLENGSHQDKKEKLGHASHSPKTEINKRRKETSYFLKKCRKEKTLLSPKLSAASDTLVESG